jgi:Xaa-Pro aminopeptidase
MRRGLIEWSKTELPESAFDTRIAAMRSAMGAAQIDALVAYTNFTRPSAVSWLCDFIPYWSECALVLPKTGPLTMISAVSPRGKPWIESTTYSENLLFTPKIAPETARVLKASLPDGAVIGVVELDEVPAAVGLALKTAGATLVDATDAFVAARAAGDAASAALAQVAAEFASRALSAFDANGNDAAAAVAAVDREARSLGAEESYVAVAADLRADRRLLRLEGPARLGEVYALRATVAYKGMWVRMIRTVVRGDAHGLVAQATERFAAVVARLPRLDDLRALDWWLVETARAAQPLEAVAGSAVPLPHAVAAGSLVSVQAAIAVDGTPVLVGAPAFAGTAGTPGAFVVAPLVLVS